LIDVTVRTVPGRVRTRTREPLLRLASAADPGRRGTAPLLDEAEDRRLVELYDQGLPLAEIRRLTGAAAVRSTTPCAAASGTPTGRGRAASTSSGMANLHGTGSTVPGVADVVTCEVCGEEIPADSATKVVWGPVTGPAPDGSDTQVVVEPSRWFCCPEHALESRPPDP
jgi:hypothetical protein